MSDRDRRRSAAATAGVLSAVLALVALTALGTRGLPGRAMRQGRPLLDLTSPRVGEVIMWGSIVIAAAVLVIALWPGDRAPLPARPRPSLKRLLMGILVIAVVLSALRLAVPPETDSEIVEETPAAVEIGRDVHWGMLLLAGALGLTLFGLVAMGRRPGRSGTLAPLDEPAETLAVDERLPSRDISESPVVASDDEYKQRIIELYSTMLADLDRRGAPRRTEEAPGEYSARLSAESVVVGHPAINDLTEWFTIAGFSDRQLGTDAVADAGAALVRTRTRRQEER